MTDFANLFHHQITAEEINILAELDSPLKIQTFLDSVQYPAGERNRSVLNVLRERQAHCLDGGLFGAAALSWLGHPAMILDILPEPGKDDDHVLALFRENDCWGAVAKSNFVGLRFREPVYRTLRELVMSYFEQFFNVHGEKTMRAYTRPIRLIKWNSLNWLWDDHGVDIIEKKLKQIAYIPIFSRRADVHLNRIDEITYQSGMSMVNHEGLFKPG